MNQSEGKPEALRLADALEQGVRLGLIRRGVAIARQAEDAAALLRSQHAEIERLRAIERAAKADGEAGAALAAAHVRLYGKDGVLTMPVPPECSAEYMRACDTNKALRAALAADAGQAGEGATK